MNDNETFDNLTHSQNTLCNTVLPTLKYLHYSGLKKVAI